MIRATSVEHLRPSAILSLLALLAGTAACGGDAPSGPDLRVASVALDLPDAPQIEIGASLQLSAAALNGSGAEVPASSFVWTSSNEQVATVTQTGRVTGLTAGGTEISATEPESGRRGAVSLTIVQAAVASVALLGAEATMYVGEEQALTVQLRDARGEPLTGRLVTWSSSAPDRADVDADGVITARSAGVTTITATSEGKSAQLGLTVRQVPVHSIELHPSEFSLQVDSTVRVEATLKDAAGSVIASGTQVAWHVADTTVASVTADGVVRGRKPGVTAVFAEAGEEEAHATVTVTEAPAFSFVLGTFTGSEASITAPRTNTVDMLITVGRKEGFDGDINIDIEDAPETLWAWVEPMPSADGSWVLSDIPQGETQAILKVLPRSDAPDGFVHLTIRGEAIGTSIPDHVVELTVAIARPEREPMDTRECRAQWENILTGVEGANGWRAISRLKDGVFGTFPDDRYKEWMFILGDGPNRERIVLHEDSFSAQGMDYAATGSVAYQPGRCTVTLMDLDKTFARGWDIDGYSANAETGQWELRLGSGRGAETTYTKPTYDLTLVRDQLP